MQLRRRELFVFVSAGARFREWVVILASMQVMRVVSSVVPPAT